jgi:hypothetical protein
MDKENEAQERHNEKKKGRKEGEEAERKNENNDI